MPSPRELISSADNEAVLRLFAGALDEAGRIQKRAGCASIMRPGPFWLLARRNPSIQDLDSWLTGVLPPGWPPWFGRNLEAIRQDPLTDVFRSCLKGIGSPAELTGRDACRIMGAIAQTLYAKNSGIASRNRSLALACVPRMELGPEWIDQERFVSGRPDERGGCIGSGGVTLWLASHVGPAFADKMENQDAVCAAETGTGIVFALADGVSTSLGSRFAAAMAAHRFCAETKQLLADAPAAEAQAAEAMLIDAARRTQRGFDETLDRILANPAGPEMNAIGASPIQTTLTSALLRNTQTAAKGFLQPALATTLIGGVLDRANSGESQCHIISIGDGAVERIREDGCIDQLVATQYGEMAIQGSLGPGPLSRETLEGGQVKFVHIVLRKQECLLISSDGLTRGHQDPVFVLATKLIGDFRPRLTRASRNVALEILGDLVSAAESRHPGADLFEDNLSLILAGVE